MKAFALVLAVLLAALTSESAGAITCAQQNVSGTDVYGVSYAFARVTCLGAPTLLWAPVAPVQSGISVERAVGSADAPFVEVATLAGDAARYEDWALTIAWDLPFPAATTRLVTGQTYCYRARPYAIRIDSLTGRQSRVFADYLDLGGGSVRCLTA